MVSVAEIQQMKGKKMNLIVHKVNYRVEASWNYGMPFTHPEPERDAKDLADYISRLKNVRADVIYDLEYECPNCHIRREKKADLIGCCEANLGESLAS